jgi:hypothetical protein
VDVPKSASHRNGRFLAFEWNPSLSNRIPTTASDRRLQRDKSPTTTANGNQDSEAIRYKKGLRTIR